MNPAGGSYTLDAAVGSGDEQDDEPQGKVDLVDDSYVPTLTATWRFTDIASKFAGPGSGALKHFVRDFVKHLIRHVLVETPGAIVPIPPMVIVYHGEEPSADDNLSPKEYLR